jgi:hypothetical protein
LQLIPGSAAVAEVAVAAVVEAGSGAAAAPVLFGAAAVGAAVAFPAVAEFALERPAA